MTEENDLILNSLSKEAHSIEEIRSKIFDVQKIQLHTGIEGFNSPNVYGIFKKTGGDALGTVGKVFEPTQPSFLFEHFVDCLQDIPDADLNGLEYKELKGSKKVIFSCPIGKVAYINKLGKEDEMDLMINLMTGFDGFIKTSMFISCYRLICGNGMKAWKTEFLISYKNTIGNIGKANLLCNQLAKAIQSKSVFLDVIKQLQQKEITQKQQNEFIQKVTGYDLETYAKMLKKKNSIIDKINEAVAIEMKDGGTTAWSLLNGVTRYTNHMTKAKNIDDFIYVDGGAKMNSFAQKLTFQMLN